MLAEEPTPAFAVEVAEECERLLGQLGNDQLRSIALFKMEGYTVAEIAAENVMRTALRGTRSSVDPASVEQIALAP